MPKNLTTPTAGKIIRDPIHGDIVIKDKFVDLIDTPEFQRLRRVSQLGLTYLLFPAAEHSRFSHSLGTYHIMRLIIKHFKEFLADMNLSQELGEEKINLALAAALLHDVGHGPFSHTFERIAGELAGGKAKEHEEWTREIILGAESQLRQVLEENFGPHFPRQVADLITDNYEQQTTTTADGGFEQINLLNILSSLVSSQLDADRMDYLLRDAYFTGVAYGKFDLSRLINSLSITVENNNYYVCIPEKYLSTVEEYLISRYHMYKEIYAHEFKREMELVLTKIMLRANFLAARNKLGTNLPAAVNSLFNGREIKVKDYIELDDISILGLVKSWKNHSDAILSKLCRIFLNRDKFTQLNLLNNLETQVEEFKANLTELLAEYGFNKSLTESFFWLEGSAENNLYRELYREEQEMIGILGNGGRLKDFIDVSNVIKRATVNPRSPGKQTTFINFSLLQEEVSSKPELISRVKNLITAYNLRSQIEITRKYKVSNQAAFNKLKQAVKDFHRYQITKQQTIQQADYYFDTADKKLLQTGQTVKLTAVNSNWKLKISSLAKDKNEKRFQDEREVSVTDQDYSRILSEQQGFISRRIPELSLGEVKNLNLKLEVITDRELFSLQEKKVEFELACDCLQYKNKSTGQETTEYMVTLELKSDYPHRINLNNLSNYLENQVTELKRITESNYQRAVKLTE